MQTSPLMRISILINFTAAETFAVQIVSGAGFYTAFTNNSLVTQLIAGRDIVTNSAFLVGSNVVTLREADIDNSSTLTQASLLQTRLRTLTALADVTVTYSAGNYLFGFANGAIPAAMSFVSGSTASASEVSDKTLGRINIAANLQSVRLFFDGRSRIFQREDFASDALALADLQAKLDALAPGSTVRIDTSALATLGYQITIEGYDPGNPLIVTVDHGDFPPLANNQIETLKIVQQRDEVGEWHTLTSGGTHGVPMSISLFSDADAASSEDKFISPYMTIEQEGPRLIELPTGLRMPAGLLFRQERPTSLRLIEIVTDNDVDKVTISGSSGTRLLPDRTRNRAARRHSTPTGIRCRKRERIPFRFITDCSNQTATINAANGKARNLLITIRGIDRTTAGCSPRRNQRRWRCRRRPSDRRTCCRKTKSSTI